MDKDRKIIVVIYRRIMAGLMCSGWRQACRDRGAILLETALVLPIFLALLCFCIDIPRFLAVKQRTLGAARLVAEIRARNGGSLKGDGGVDMVSAEKLADWFFDDPYGKNISLTIDSGSDKESIFYDITNIEKKIHNIIIQDAAKFLKALANIISGGNLNPYLFNVFNKDLFYRGAVTAKVKPILPARAYKGFTDDDPFGDSVSIKAEVFVPGCDSCKYTGKSFIEDIIDFLNGQ